MANALVHNGSRIQGNVFFLQYGGAYPFMNWIKAAGDLFFADQANAPVTPDLLDVNGYPNTARGIGVLCFGPDPVFARPGNRVLLWTGTGTPTLGFQSTLVSPGTGGAQSSLTPVGGVGRYEFTTTENRFDIRFDNTVKNLVLCHVDDEPRLAAGEVFDRNFLAIMRKFGVVRFLDWMYGNTSNVTTWATRKPVNYLFYHGDERRASIYAQTAATRTRLAYSCTGPSGFALADKALVTFKVQDSYVPPNATFTNGSDVVNAPSHQMTSADVGNPVWLVDENPADQGPAVFPSNVPSATKLYIQAVPDANTVKLSLTNGGAAIVANANSSGAISLNPQITLNVSGTGTKPILSSYSSNLIRGFNNYPVGGAYNSLATAMYDATLDAYIKIGGDADAGPKGIENGVPPELMVRLCAEIGGHPHFVTPMFTIDPATDYMPELANYCRNNGPSWMIPAFEGPNELWNNSAGFYQTGYANAKATAYGWGADAHNWYGKAMSVLGQLVGAVFAGDKTKYEVIGCVQTASMGYGPATNNPRFASTLYIGTTPQAPVTGSFGTITISASVGVAEAYRVVTAGGCAQYFTPSDYGESQETTKAVALGGSFFVASFNGDVMNVLSLSDDSTIAANLFLMGQGAAGGALAAGTQVLAFGTGGTSGTGTTGTYKLNKAQSGFPTTTPVAVMGWLDFSQADSYADSSLNGDGGTNIPAEAYNYNAFKTFLKGFGIKKMRGYEGGYSPDFRSTAQINRLRALSKLSTHLRAIMWTNYDNWTKLSDGDFVASFPSFYVVTGSIDGGKTAIAWSVLDDIYQNPKPPIWQNVLDIADHGGRLRLSTN